MHEYPEVVRFLETWSKADQAQREFILSVLAANLASLDGNVRDAMTLGLTALADRRKGEAQIVRDLSLMLVTVLKPAPVKP